MSFSNIKGIIFDLGYTLIDYKETGWPKVRQEALQSGFLKLQANHVNLPEFDKFVSMYQTKKEEYRRRNFNAMLGWNIIDVIKDLLDEFDVKDSLKYSRDFIETVYDIERKQMIIDNSTIEILRSFKDRGFRIGVISNTIYPAYLHENDMKMFGWNQYFDFQIYSSECKYRKPHPSIFEAAINVIGLPAENSIYVGDRYRLDGLGAQKAGLIPVIKYCKKQTYPDQWPDGFSVIDNVSELPDLLKI